MVGLVVLGLYAILMLEDTQGATGGLGTQGAGPSAVEWSGGTVGRRGLDDISEGRLAIKVVHPSSFFLKGGPLQGLLTHLFRTSGPDWCRCSLPDWALFLETPRSVSPYAPQEEASEGRPSGLPHRCSIVIRTGGSSCGFGGITCCHVPHQSLPGGELYPFKN